MGSEVETLAETVAERTAEVEDLSGEKLAGAVFAIYDNAQASGTPIETGLTTGANGVVLSAKSYEPGKTYYVKEIEAPFGYKADETIIRPVTMEDVYKRQVISSMRKRLPRLPLPSATRATRSSRWSGRTSGLRTRSRL